MEIPHFEYCNNDLEIHQSKEMVNQGPTKLEQLLCSRWDNAIDKGYFKYTLDDIQTIPLEGEYKFYAQLNVKRGTERRKPQSFSGMDQPFNSDAFNFTKVKDNEVLFSLGKTSLCSRKDGKCYHNINQSLIQTRRPAYEVEAKFQVRTHLTSKFKDKFLCRNANEQIFDKKSVMNDDESRNDQKDVKHVVVINVSPLEYGHCLLVPFINQCLPQVLTRGAIAIGLELLLLTRHLGFVVGFNSLCGYASINHLHMHTYYFSWPLALADWPLRSLVGGILYETVDWVTHAFVIIVNDTNVEKYARQIHSLTSYLQHNSIAHNLVMIRGSEATSMANMEGDKSPIRVFIWARKSIYAKEAYETITEKAACESLKGTQLPRAELDKITSNFCKLLTQQ